MKTEYYDSLTKYELILQLGGKVIVLLSLSIIDVLDLFLNLLLGFQTLHGATLLDHSSSWS